MEGWPGMSSVWPEPPPKWGREPRERRSQKSFLGEVASGQQAGFPLTRGFTSSKRYGRVPRAHVVDEGGEPFGELRVLELEHVFGVQLARVGQVEAADEDRVVGDGDLRVHVVVDRT